MTSEKYWKEAALLREIAVQEGATHTAKDILKLYDEALDDINKEIALIKANFQRRFGLDNETATFFLTQAQQEENLNNLVKALELAPDKKARQNILDFVHRDGLSVRAYAARKERYEAVETLIYARVKKLAVEETELLESTLKKAYKESYYGLIDDTAKGLNMGVNFAMLNDDAIDEAVYSKWHGKRFSKRIWDNTDRLAREAQELVIKGLMSGVAQNKIASELADTFGVEKYRATTLIHTETSHIHSKADLKAYEDLNIKEYKYLATLDYVTCEECQPLDNQVFKVSEAREGYNYPTMHPRCRCTTTINIEYGNRRARNPLTGKNGIVDGDLTYSQWVDTLNAEEKAALNISRKKDSNKTADKLQHIKYKKVLGTETVPKKFANFQDMKYNDVEKWKDLKRLYRYENNPYLQKQLSYVLPNGERNFIPNKANILSVKTIAGAGSKTELRIEKRLVEEFGGVLGEWKKRVGKIESEKHIFDVHWYELDRKQYKMKLKNRGDKK